MAKYWGTPPFFTQNFFFQNDSEWLEMDFKHIFIKYDILTSGPPWRRPLIVKLCFNFLWTKKMYPTFIYSYSGSATIPLKPPSLENLPANSSIVLFWYTYKTIILLPVFLILGRIPLSTAPAGLPNNRQLILKKVTVWMIHHLRYLCYFRSLSWRNTRSRPRRWRPARPGPGVQGKDWPWPPPPPPTSSSPRLTLGPWPAWSAGGQGLGGSWAHQWPTRSLK